MPNILTPSSLFNNLNLTLPLSPVIVSSAQVEDVKIDRIIISGRETEGGRVQIAAAFAYNVKTPSAGTVLIFPDSKETVDDDLLKFFVSRGYSAMMVDYRGEWEGETFYTRYPDDIAYANTLKCGRRKDFVDDSADKTCWYEWVGIGLYAIRYIKLRTGNASIAAVGIRDGGEIVWKLGVASELSCIVPVNAAGWKSYAGISKYVSEEPSLDEERYRFIAGIDSQAYAPYVKCPVLMLCSTDDTRFDYDRAFDTFSRINPAIADESAIAFSVKNNGCISPESTADMFLMFDKNLRKRQVFIPDTPEITIDVDEQSNLLARVKIDGNGIADSCRLYLAEDRLNGNTREWCVCALKTQRSENVYDFYLDVYEKTAMIFALCRVKYSNGFTVWSRVTAKKISGRFRNTKNKCKVMYSDGSFAEDFAVGNAQSYAAGGIFFHNEAFLPKTVTKARGVTGFYSPCGLATLRISNPRFVPPENSLLSMDFFPDGDAELKLTVTDLSTGENYTHTVKTVGGAWQNVISESANFKTANGTPLADFIGDYKFTLTCPVGYAVTNLMWL